MQTQLYEVAATLSPVLLLVTVLGLRRILIDTSYRWRVAVMMFTVVPANWVMLFSVSALAFDLDPGWWVLAPLFVQIGSALGMFMQALLRPGDIDIS